MVLEKTLESPLDCKEIQPVHLKGDQSWVFIGRTDDEIETPGWQYIVLMYSFSYLEPVCCSMSSSSCCFLTCIQISKEEGQVVWYSHLFQIFPQFTVIHTVKGFGIGNKAEIYIFWNSLAFLMIQQMLAIWSLVPLPFLKPAWTSGSSQFTYCWSLACRILSITLLACEMSAMLQLFMDSLALPFFGIGMKTDLFQSCGHRCVS